MCGICGVISERRDIVEPATRRMMAAMIHRGPDDEGYEELPLGSDESGPVAGFGFRRLSILDLSTAGHQPMFNQNTGDCLIFNGEIYNFRSLRAQLQLGGVLFRGTSDSEVLLHALGTWGEAALEKLQGMYAFAYYEAKSRRILMARDPLGIKPLYVAQTTNCLVFASEVRGVLASRLVSDELDPAGVAGMLAYGAPQDPLTVHRAIRSLPAGEYRWCDIASHERQTSRRFWRYPPTEKTATAVDAATSHVKTLLSDAVASHLVADRPVGVFLSAGIDSFSIASLAKKVQGQIKTFTVGFDEPGLTDEVAAAEAAAKALGTDHHSLILESSSIGPAWDSWLEACDRPSIDGFNTFVVSRAVASAGKTVALSGLGGDEIFGGYPNFVAAPRYRRILSALQPVPWLLKRIGLQLVTRGHRSTYHDKASELLNGDHQTHRIALRLRRILTDRQIVRLGLVPAALGLDADFLSPSALDSVADTQAADDFNVVSQIESALYMGNTLLRDTDGMSMANSLEVRVPLLDQRLINYVMALQGRTKTRAGGPTKFILRQACLELIPQSLANRQKTGFCLPIDRWMHGPLRESCEAAIKAVKESGILDAQEIRSIWTDFIECRRNVHWVRPMTLVSLGGYLQHRVASGPTVSA